MGVGGAGSIEMRMSPFSGGWGVTAVFFGFRLGDMMDVRIVRYYT